jgi:hypothetical protein
MTVADTSSQVFSNSANRALDTFGLWTEVGQKVSQQLLDLSASSAKEGLRLLAEIQATNIDAVRGNLGFVAARQGAVEELRRDPQDWYRTTVLSGVEQAKQTARVLEGNATALTKYAETLQATATEAANNIQEAFETVAERVRSDADATTETVKTMAKAPVL